MNKAIKFFHLFLIAIGLICSNTNCGKLTEAINKLDVKEVERILIEKKSLSKENKNKLKNIIKKNIKLYKRTICQFTKFSKLKPPIKKIDTAKITIGTICSLTGAFVTFLAIDSFKFWYRKKQLLDQYNSRPNIEQLEANRHKKSYWNIIDFQKDFNIGLIAMVIASGLLKVGVDKLYCSYKIYATLSKLEKIYQIKELIKNVSLNN